MAEKHTIKPLTLDTWGAYAAFIEKHNGVWGGCWCSWFHPDTPENPKKELGGHDFKRQMVEIGVAHAALVFDGDQVIGWANYGSPAELVRINHQKEYNATQPNPAPYRITCFFVDRDRRREGIAREALAGALDLIAKEGGGTVEAYPHDLPLGKKTSASFLHGGTRTLFEAAGFTYDRPLGTQRTVMHKTIAPS
jgi:GNAT superfamily N-acetyltransferase